MSYIARKGLKANIITNTVALSRELLRRLFEAGLYGLTCHFDMLQDRPGMNGNATEIEIMPLRQQIADLVWEVGKGKIYCTFNSTVYHENFQYLPDIVRWARSNPKKVHGLDFITYRGVPIKEGLQWDVGEGETKQGEQLRESLGYVDEADQVDITSVDVYNLLKDNFGEVFEPCAYLGGTGHVKDYKWWGQVSVVDRNGRELGSIGPRTVEFLQILYHWFRGRYFMYLRKNSASFLLLLMTAFIGDKKMRSLRKKIALRYLNPFRWFQLLHFQSIGINQPPDMLEDGTANMCESCPDACVFEDNLVSSCRLDEYRKFGKMMNAIVHNEHTDKRAAEPVEELVRK